MILNKYIVYLICSSCCRFEDLVYSNDCDLTASHKMRAQIVSGHTDMKLWPVISEKLLQ